MTIEHTQGNLRVEKPFISYCRLVCGEEEVIGTFGDDGEPSEADQRRIAATWNACQGITTESLEEHGATSFESAVTLAMRNAELVKALRDILPLAEWALLQQSPPCADQAQVDAAKVAIAKINGAA